MEPLSDSDRWEIIRAQIQQGMIEHQIVAQSLRAQSVISGCFCVVLGLLSFLMWRRSVASGQALVEQAKRHYSEQSERERRHSRELIELQRQHGMEQVSTARTTLQQFAEALQPKQGG